MSWVGLAAAIILSLSALALGAKLIVESGTVGRLMGGAVWLAACAGVISFFGLVAVNRVTCDPRFEGGQPEQRWRAFETGYDEETCTKQEGLLTVVTNALR